MGGFSGYSVQVKLELLIRSSQAELGNQRVALFTLRWFTAQCLLSHSAQRGDDGGNDADGDIASGTSAEHDLEAAPAQFV